jgi:hypothetical protein
VIDGHRDPDELGLVPPALGEERPQGPVDHARDQRGGLTRAALALEEGAGNLPGRVHALLDVHGERHEVDVAQVARRGGGQDAGVAGGDEHGTRGLLGQASRLEHDLASADLDGDLVHF